MKTETVTTINYNELDLLVQKHIVGFPNWEFVPSYEATNDSVYRFRAIKNEVDYDALDWNAPDYVSVTDLLCVLCDRDIIPEGTVLVEVSW